MARRWWLLALFVVAWSQAPNTALGAACGQGSGDPPVGVLEPLVEGSTTQLDFPDDDGTDLLLIFNLSNCGMGPEIAGRIAVDYEFASVDGSAFGPKSADATVTRARWEIPVDSTKIQPGVHRGSVVIGGNETIVKRITIPVILTKSESVSIALTLGAAAWLIGVIGAFLTVSTVKRNSWRLGSGAILAVIPVAAILKAQYFDVQGWTGADSELLLFIGVLAASFGAAKAAMLERSKVDDHEQSA